MICHTSFSRALCPEVTLLSPPKQSRIVVEVTSIFPAALIAAPSAVTLTALTSDDAASFAPLAVEAAAAAAAAAAADAATAAAAAAAAAVDETVAARTREEATMGGRADPRASSHESSGPS